MAVGRVNVGGSGAFKQFNKFIIIRNSDTSLYKSFCMTADNIFAYIGSDNLIYKMSLKDMAIQEDKVVGGNGIVRSIHYKDGFLYATWDRKVIKVDVESMDIVASSPVYSGVLSDLYINDDYLYCVGGNANDGHQQKLWKLKMGNLSLVAESPFLTTGELDNLRWVVTDKDYIYTSGVNTAVHKLDINTLSKVASGLSGNIGGAIIGDYLYTLSNNALIKADKTNLSEIKRTVLGTEFLFPAHGFLYSKNREGKIIEIIPETLEISKESEIISNYLSNAYKHKKHIYATIGLNMPIPKLSEAYYKK